MRLLVTGDRNWHDYKLIKDALAGKEECVCHGGASGADALAGEACRERGYKPTVFYAQWRRYGRSAGPIRNREMLLEFKPTMVYAFHDDLENSKGTKDMVRIALKANVRVIHFSHRHPEGKVL